MTLPIPDTTLDAPGTILFTAERALQGSALNRLALSLRWPENRASFLADPDAYQDRFGLTEIERDMVRRRDWTAMLFAGGHLQALLKLAVTLGEDLWHIGAHTVGCSRDTLFDAGPRPISATPSGGSN